MFNFFNIKKYSLTTKVVVSFLFFIIIFIGFKLILSIPSIEQKSLNDEIEQISRNLLITTKQLKIILESIKMQADLEIKNNKDNIENDIKNIDKNLNKQDLINTINKSKIPTYCDYSIKNKENNILLNQWYRANKDEMQSNRYRDRSSFLYNYLFNNDLVLSLECKYRALNRGHVEFERKLKQHMDTKLLIDPNLKSVKIALFWANSEYKDLDIPFYTQNEQERKERYGFGDLSNVDNLPTGDLSLKQILAATTNSPFEYIQDNKTKIYWFYDLTTFSTSLNRYLLLTYSVDKEELENKNKAIIFFLLPETLLSIGISLFLIFFLFRRILKNIDTLTKTAMKVNQGNKHVRSNVKGEDNIGILGQSFDSMLDFFENNIEILDKKIEEKTKELKISLQEKENLLNEIHHRIKNNLAMTIALIKLQQSKITDENTKKTLEDTQNRIYTMELLHRKLYETDNLDLIEVRNYFTNLVIDIKNSFNHDKNIELLFDIKEGIYLKIEIILPCALILNEIITNFFKYVLEDVKEPKLEISFKKDLSNYFLIVKDNGRGLPENFDLKNSNTLGLKLINSISTLQLKGKCEYKYEKGAVFEIIF